MLREFAIDLPCDESVAVARQALTGAGLRVEQSFDLRAALSLVPDCTCPHHGTALCDCQYNVLLVYQQANSAPATLIAHGHDHRSWLTISCPPGGQVPGGLVFEIIQILAGVHLIALGEDADVSSSANVTY